MPDCDLKNLEQVEYYFKNEKPTLVIHLAAKVGGVKNNSDNLATFYEENIQINTNVLSMAHKYKVKKTYDSFKIPSYIAFKMFKKDLPFFLNSHLDFGINNCDLLHFFNVYRFN